MTDLDPDFDRSCRACGIELKEMPIISFTEAAFAQPLYILQCAGCKGRLFVFSPPAEAPVKPLVLRSDEIRHQYPFTEFLARRMEAHIRKHSSS